MTRQVGIDEQGRLWTTISPVDQVVTFGSSNAVSSNAVWEYGNNLADSTRGFIEEEIQEVQSDYNSKINSVDGKVDDTNENLLQTQNKIQGIEKDVSSLQISNTELSGKIDEASSSIEKIQQKDTEQDASIQQLQEDLNTKIETVEGNIQSAKTELQEDYNAKIQGLKSEVDANKNNISSLQSGILESNKNIEQNSQKISENEQSIDSIKEKQTELEQNIQTNANNISKLNQRVTSNESSIQTQTSRINNLSDQSEQQSTQIQELQQKKVGIFFNTEEEITQWISEPENTKNLQIGTGLYLYNTNKVYYIWNGTSVLKFQHIDVPSGGYMLKNNPTGNGYIVMNNCISGSNGAVFGNDNNAYGVNSLVSGIGMKISSGYSFGVGKYNKPTESNEIFTVGTGESDSNRKTGMRVFNNGDQSLSGDLVAYESDISSPNKPFVAKCRFTYLFSNMPSNVRPRVDYDTFYSNITQNEENTYEVVRDSEQWYIQDQKYRAEITDLSQIGITFVYTDDTEGIPEFEFSDGDTVSVYAPPQIEISLRDFYSKVAAMNLYVDEDGDVCQYES